MKKETNVSFAEKLGHFLLFVILTIITAGLYLLWWSVTMFKEQNELLKDIRNELRQRRI